MKTINSSGYRVFEENIVSGNGTKVFNELDESFIDFEAGVWSLPLGHNPKSVNDVIIEQLKLISHVGYLYNSKIVDNTADLLLKINNIDDGKCVFLSSGSEAIEYAVQVAKKVFPDKKGCRLKNFYLSAYGVASNQNSDWIDIDDNLDDIDFKNLGHFLFEPGNYSGLVKLPNKELIKDIVSRIKKNNGIVIVDEVTTGFGRTGELFGYMHYSFVPDIIVLGKR